jgi:hypothetical protein
MWIKLIWAWQTFENIPMNLRVSKEKDVWLIDRVMSSQVANLSHGIQLVR